ADALSDESTADYFTELIEGEAPTGSSVDDIASEITYRLGNPELFTEIEPETWVRGISGTHIHWNDAEGEHHTEWNHKLDIEREPNVRIDISPHETESIEEFRMHLLRRLYCQMRDVYIGMGIAPPEPFRIQRHGIYKYSAWYENYDMYERYHDQNAEITTWFEEYTPDEDRIYEHEDMATQNTGKVESRKTKSEETQKEKSDVEDDSARVEPA
ncbi:MAG: hypothetical protein SXQ77_02375, partial [Halobacteria archaeon]|nr:hypothetical protein [Halobacteria archaeon]